MTMDHSAMALAAERLEVMDALYRFGAGVDHNDANLLARACSDDAVADFSPCGHAMGLDFSVLTGSAAIVGSLCGNDKKQTTSHVTETLHRPRGGPCGLERRSSCQSNPRN